VYNVRKYLIEKDYFQFNYGEMYVLFFVYPKIGFVMMRNAVRTVKCGIQYCCVGVDGWWCVRKGVGTGNTSRMIKVKKKNKKQRMQTNWHQFEVQRTQVS